MNSQELVEIVKDIHAAPEDLKAMSDYELDALADRLEGLLREYEYSYNDDTPEAVRKMIIEKLRLIIERVRVYKDINKSHRGLEKAQEDYERVAERNNKIRRIFGL